MVKGLHLHLRHNLYHSYDEEADKVNQYQRLILEGLEKIEIGKTLKSFSRSEDAFTH